MAATPKNAQLTFRGVSGMTYNIDAYVSDVVAGLVNFDSGAGAGAATDTFWLPPEGCSLVDVAIVTGMADTTKLQLTRNGVPTGNIFRYVAFVDTIANRPPVNVPFMAGSKIGCIQLA